MNKKISLFLNLFLLITTLILGANSVYASTETDYLKGIFGASEIVSYEGSYTSPTRVIFWATATCPGSPNYAYTVPTGYTSTSCSLDSSLGTHGGCPDCIMAKIELVKTSTTIITTDTTAPSVTVTNPKYGSTISGTVTLTADATDNVGVVGVQFVIGGLNIGSEDTSAPYSVDLDTTTIKNNYYYIYAIARDAAGNTKRSANNLVRIYNTGTVTPVNGECGSADGSTVSTAPTTNLCNKGTASAVTGTGPWAWTCAGLNGGTTASCSANKQGTTTDTTAPSVTVTNPKYGSTISGTVTLTADATDNVGVVGVQFVIGGLNIGSEDTSAPYSVDLDTTTIKNNYYYIYAIARDAAGNTKRSANNLVRIYNTGTVTPVNGECGSADGSTVSTAPTTNLCNKGTASAVTGTGPWAWTCAGLNGGTTASCSANKQGTTTDTTAPSVTVTNPKYGSTISGTVTLTADATDNVGVVGVQFVIGGLNIGSEDTSAPYSVDLDTTTIKNNYYYIYAIARDAAGNTKRSANNLVRIYNTGTVTPVNGECGSADGSTVSTAPTTNLCNKGTASAVTGTGPWAWTCAGLNGGTTASCSANKQGTTTDTTAPSVTVTNPKYGSTISGTVTLTADATDNVGVAGVQFVIGGLNIGSEDTSAPYSVDLDTTTIKNNYYYIYAIARDAAGNTKRSANNLVRIYNTGTVTPVNGECGSADGSTVSTAPTTNLCNKGTASAVTGTGPWAWTCAGLNGGTTASCSANKTVADSIAPVISITSPTNFSTVSGIITISADATDNVGVVGVKFFVDGVQLGSEDMTAPYSTTLDTKTLANGSHTILARARDAVGNNAAREITVTVNNTTVTPVNGECGSADGSTVSTAPTTNLCNKGTASAVTGTGPWAWTCAGLNGGTTASCSANKTVADSIAPVISITSPTNFSTVSGIITISADATDNVGVVGVKFFVDGVQLGSEDMTAPYSTTLDTKTLANGSHTILARARDAVGNNAAREITVTVNNTTVTPVNGECGSADGSTVSTAPTTNLCNKGTASAVTGTGPWAWTCAGLNGGTTASCSANKTVVTDNLIQNPSFEESDASSNPVGWFTGGWGTNTPVFTYPVAGYNSAKAAKVQITSYTDGDAKWYFNDVSVLANQEYKISLNYQSNTTGYLTVRYTLSDATVQYADIGTLTPSAGWASVEKTFTTPANTVSVTVFSLINSVGYLTVDNFYLNKTSSTTPVNGECGSADGSTVSTAPTTNLCNKGTASAVTGTGPWAWTCAGLNGGTTASCSANKTVVTDNLIQNPSFEESDASSNPVGWFTGGWGTNTPVFTYPVAGYNSAKAAKVQITSYTDGDAKWYFNDVSVLANQEYKISLNYQSNTTGYLTVRYTLSDATVQYADIGTLTPSAGWASVEKTFTTPANTVSVTVFSLINSVGYLTVDNFYLSKTTITPISQGQVSLNFDDGWLSVYNNALPILNAAGYKSTQYIISNQIGAASYVTASQILAMQATGHEIGAHSQTHADLTTLSGTQLQNEIVGSKQDLLNIGVTQVLTYAYPYGSTNSTIISSIQSTGFIGARGVEGGYNDKTSNKYILNSYSIESSTTINTIKNWIDTAVANNTWVILVFHRVDTSGEQYSVTPQMLQQIVDYLKLKNVSVVTNAQGLQSLSE